MGFPFTASIPKFVLHLPSAESPAKPPFSKKHRRFRKNLKIEAAEHIRVVYRVTLVALLFSDLRGTCGDQNKAAPPKSAPTPKASARPFLWWKRRTCLANDVVQSERLAETYG